MKWLTSTGFVFIRGPLLRLADCAEADHPVALEGWPGGGAGVGPEVQRLGEECASAQYAVGSGLRALGVFARRERIVVSAVPVLAPLHHVAGHVVCPIRRGVVV